MDIETCGHKMTFQNANTSWFYNNSPIPCQWDGFF